MKALIDWIKKRLPSGFERFLESNKSKEIDNIFMHFATLFNIAVKHEKRFNDLFEIDKHNITYFPILYVTGLREYIIKRYSKSDDPIEKGYMSKSNLEYTMEYVKQMYDNVKPLKDKIIKKAAFILYNIISKHPFTDGNKRTGIITCNSFLEYNGYSIAHLPYKESYDFILAVAKGEKAESDCEKFIRKYIRELEITDELRDSLNNLGEQIKATRNEIEKE